VKDKAALVAYTLRSLLVPPSRQARAPERSAAEDLARFGISGAATERFLRPFLSGVTGDPDLATSSRVVSLLWRTFALGDLTLPSRGIGTVPGHLAARLPAGTVHLTTRVTGLAPSGAGVDVRTDRGPVRAGAVIVAAEGTDAAALLEGRVEAPHPFALTTHYHVTDTPPTRQGLLHLDGTGGPVVNTVVLTAAAPSYSPDHRHLVASTVLGAEPLPEPRLRGRAGADLGTGHGVVGAPEHGVDPARAAGHAAPDPAPPAPPGRPRRRPVRGRRPPGQPVGAGRAGQRAAHGAGGARAARLRVGGVPLSARSPVRTSGTRRRS
jgi:hypothetical protein